MAKGSNTRLFLGQYGPMVLFGSLTFVGVAFIWTAKLWELNTAVVTAVPIGIMAVYLVVSLIVGSMRVHNEQAGDNLYYMGFLFTLSSLGVSLYRFAGDVSIDEIVRNFGIAVTSTICGIAFRIFFNQMRRDPIDIERSVRHELAEMTRRVRSEMDSSAREFSSHRRTSSQMLLEGFEEIALQAEKTGEAVQKVIEALSKESLKPIQEAAAKLATISEENLKIVEQRAATVNELADTATEKLGVATEKIASLVGDLSTSIGALTTKMDQMRMPDEVIRVELKPTLDAISKVSDLQNRRSEDAAKRVDQQTTAFLEAVKPVTEVPSQIASSLQPVSDLSKTLQEIVASISTMPSQLAALVSTLDQTAGSLKDLIKHQLDADSADQQPVRIKTGAMPAFEEKAVASASYEKSADLQAIFNGDASSTISSPTDIAAITPALDLANETRPREHEDDKPKKRWFRAW